MTTDSAPVPGILSAHGLTVSGRLAGCDIALRPGTVTAICGPNGAGKSTLLSSLAGLQRPGAGAVMLGDVPLSRLSARERALRIGYLPQDGEVAWNISVATLANLGRIPHRSGADEDAAAVAEALSNMDLSAFAARPVGTLSGGERARALLARVLAGRPGWILADEPLAALDLAHQAALLGNFRRLADEGRGIVLVLHDLALAMNHADRVVVLDKGRVAADGPPAEALSESTIARVWRVPARWLQDDAGRALAY